MDDFIDKAALTSATGINLQWKNVQYRCRKPAKSGLAAAVDGYLASPNTATASDLYRSTQKLSTHNHFFTTSHATLSIQMLDTLAEHIVAFTVSSDALDAQEEASTHYSLQTQTQQTHEDALLLLELCYIFARKTSIGFPSFMLCKLLQWLVESVSVTALKTGCEIDLGLKLQLLVLAELIKMSAGVRIYVKEMKIIKDLYRSLTILLNSTEDAELIIFSMAILARLVLTESLGNKIFSDKNVGQALNLLFSVLDGSWYDSTEKRYLDSNTILNRRSLLQVVSVDLLCTLCGREEILEKLEQNVNILTSDKFMMTINLNGELEQIVVAAHFLASVGQLSHVLRRQIAASIFDQNVFYRILQATLHPSKLAAMTIAQLILTVIEDDICSIQYVFDVEANLERLVPIVTGIVQYIADVTTIVQSAEDDETFSNSDAYLHSVEVCHLLTKLCKCSKVRSLCAQTISLNQSATLIQAEAALIGCVDPQHLICFQPQLSIHLVSLLSNIVHDESMGNKNNSALVHFLQTDEVSTVISAALCNGVNKTTVKQALILLVQTLVRSSSNQINVIQFAESVFRYNQRVGEANDNLQSTISSLHANANIGAKTAKRLQTEMQQMLQFQDELKTQQDQALKDIQNKLANQIRQKDDTMQKMRNGYEAKLHEITMQCEGMRQHMNKELSALQQRDSLYQEIRGKLVIVDDENVKLKRKVELLEPRIQEISQTYTAALEEIGLRKKDLSELREKIVTISGNFTAQREELVTAYDESRRLEVELNDQKVTNETTYKELVLLSKAYKALADEKQTIESEVDLLRLETANLESRNNSIHLLLLEKEQLADRFERKISLLNDAAAISKNALDSERESFRAISLDLDDTKKYCRKLESNLSTIEIQLAEQRLLADSKDENLRKYEAEICHLTNEVGKQAKLQALIHQLSSGINSNIRTDDNLTYHTRDT
ncbi:hypothetical protein CCR75_009372 [Bremia lactucae]|uniref:Protein CIP2A n=1 Tax=Bremia lactucae TaxID=4779 RepID=A0A976FPP3_BRELC|nr:hypothetical protein CCR75_009372 [Bremia lactucae]